MSGLMHIVSDLFTDIIHCVYTLLITAEHS